jgi:hypothetical protein
VIIFAFGLAASSRRQNSTASAYRPVSAKSVNSAVNRQSAGVVATAKKARTTPVV